MAVWPFCFPCPRTSVTVIPGRPTAPSASLTSSTLLGRTMALINFISCLQHRVYVGGQLGDGGVAQLRAHLRHVEHVDRLLALGRNQHEVHVAAVPRDDAADAVQQTERVVRDDVDDRVAA